MIHRVALEYSRARDVPIFLDSRRSILQGSGIWSGGRTDPPFSAELGVSSTVLGNITLPKIKVMCGGRNFGDDLLPSVQLIPYVVVLRLFI